MDVDVYLVFVRLTSPLLQLLVGTRCRGPGQLDGSCALANTLSSAATATIQGFIVRIIELGWRNIAITLIDGWPARINEHCHLQLRGI